MNRPCLRVRVTAICVTAATTVSCARLEGRRFCRSCRRFQATKSKRFFGASESQSGKIGARTDDMPNYLSYRW